MSQFKQINPSEFLIKYKEENLIILDIREPFELHELPFEGAVNIPMYTLLNNFKDILKHNETYYILCHHGQRSFYVTEMLYKNGYDVVNIVGGVDLVNRFDSLER